MPRTTALLSGSTPFTTLEAAKLMCLERCCGGCENDQTHARKKACSALPCPAWAHLPSRGPWSYAREMFDVFFLLLGCACPLSSFIVFKGKLYFRRSSPAAVAEGKVGLRGAVLHVAPPGCFQVRARSPMGAGKI